MIKKPFLWFAQVINGKPEPWKQFPLEGLMVNAYEILKKPKANKDVREQGIHEYMEFDGPIMMDSGGFQFMKKSELLVDPNEILNLYKESKPNFGIVLDHPLGINLNRIERMDRFSKTLQNTRIMTNNHNTNGVELVPAIHGHKLSEIEWFIEELNKISSFNYLGIGSLVPSVFSTKGVGGITNVIEIVNFVRKKLLNKRIHVFGIGSILTMHLMFYAGADSVDSSGWRTKAAYGAIQIPEKGDRYITKRTRNKKYLDVSKEDKQILESCGCPICRTNGLEELRTSFTSRATHNAWVYQEEVKKARELIRLGKYEEYVKSVLSKITAFANVIKFAEKLNGS